MEEIRRMRQSSGFAPFLAQYQEPIRFDDSKSWHKIWMLVSVIIWILALAIVRYRPNAARKLNCFATFHVPLLSILRGAEDTHFEKVKSPPQTHREYIIVVRSNQHSIMFLALTGFRFGGCGVGFALDSLHPSRRIPPQLFEGAVHSNRQLSNPCSPISVDQTMEVRSFPFPILENILYDIRHQINDLIMTSIAIFQSAAPFGPQILLN
jgi:hypothetical protein